MRPSYNLYSWFIDGIPADSAVSATDTILRRHGATLNQDCVILLNDDGGNDPPPDPGGDPEAALAQLAVWPLFGSIEYELGDVFIAATFHPDEGPPDGKVYCIQISVPSDWLDDRRSVSEQCFESIARNLHSTMIPNRTVMSWSGRPADIPWSDELQRLRAGIVEGEYDVDLR